MSKRYDFAMKKGRKRKARMEGFNFQAHAMLSKDDKPMPTENKDTMLPPNSGFTAPTEWPDLSDPALGGDGLPITVHAVQVGGEKPKSQIGNELGSITDRISKVLNDYESMYSEDDDSTFSAMQQSITGQLNMENILSGYNTLCQEREELLESLQDSMDMDEEELLDQLEKMAKDNVISMEDSENAIQATFENAKTTSEKLKNLNRQIVTMSKDGQPSEKLEQEKKELEDELNMYKRMTLQQQRKDKYQRRRSTVSNRRDETQQWKLVAGEMLDIVKGIKLEGKTDKVELERELNNIILTLNNQNDQIENLKKEIETSEKNVTNLERDKTRLHNDKLLVEDELQAKRIEIQQCKKYLKKVLQEQKEKPKAVKAEEGEALHTEEDEEQVSTTGEDRGNSTHVLQAQIRDQRSKALKFEEQNKELQRQIGALQEAEKARNEKETEVAKLVATDGGSKACSNCQSIGAQLLTCREEIAELTKKNEHLVEELNNIQKQLASVEKEYVNLKSSSAETARSKEIEEPTTSESDVTEDTQDTAVEVDIDSAQTQRPAQHIVKTGKSEPKKIFRAKKKGTKAKQDDKKDGKGSPKVEEIKEEVKEEGPKRRETTATECREEKAPYVKVREAKLMTLCDKGIQTSYHGRMQAMMASHRRESVGAWNALGEGRRKHSLTDAIMCIAPPPVVEQETSIAMGVIREEVDRLCDDISGFVEYSFDLVQSEAKTLQTQAEKHLGEHANQIIGTPSLRGPDMDNLPTIADRRQSVMGSHGSRRRSTVLQLDTRRGTLRHRESRDGYMFQMRADSIGRDTILPEVEEGKAELTEEEHGKPTETKVAWEEKKGADGKTKETSHEMKQDVSDDHRPENVKFGIMHMLDKQPIAESEHEDKRRSLIEQVKEHITLMAQHAINILQSTGEVFASQLNSKLGVYERFYDFWRQSRQPFRRQSTVGRSVPVVGKQLLPTVPSSERVSKSRGREEDPDALDSGLFPQISTTAGKGRPISTAILSNKGMMMIAGSGAGRVPSTISQPAMSTKKRKKPSSWSRKQQLMKQKALVDKVLHVDARMQDLTSIMLEDGINYSQSTAAIPHGSYDPPSSTTARGQPLNLPFIAHGISRHADQSVKNEIKLSAPSMSEMERNLFAIPVTSTWNRRQSIARYHSTNEVPNTTKETEATTRLPLLTINNLFSSI